MRGRGSEAEPAPELDGAARIARKRNRRSRLERVQRSQGQKSFFASPQAALFSMVIALLAVLAFMGDVQRWVLLAIGIGAVAVVATVSFIWKRKG